MMRISFLALTCFAIATAQADRPMPVVAEPVTPTQASTTEPPVTELVEALDLSNTTNEVVAPIVSPPRLFEAVYNAKISIARGEAVMALRRTQDNRYVFSSESRARGAARLFRSKPIAECSVIGITESGHWQSQKYHFSDGKKKGLIDFDWASKRAFAAHDDKETTLQVEQGVTDRLLEQLIASRQVVDQQQILPFEVIDRAELNTINYERLGNERITVPAGSFDTVRYRRARDGSKRSSLIWFAPALDGLPVRIEQYRLDDRQAVAELKAYTDEETLQARGTVTPVCP